MIVDNGDGIFACSTFEDFEGENVWGRVGSET